MLEQITPLILTFNEAPNIGRSLDRFQWARDVVVLDSFSTDETLEIVARFPNVRLFQRTFDNFAAQWQFGLTETGISTEWVLALDADFMITTDLVNELASLRPSGNTEGYTAGLSNCVQGRRLRSSLLPRLTILYRRGAASCRADGHTYQVQLDGKLEMLRSPVLHDDRKPLSRWVEAQQKYTVLEGNKLLAADWQALNFPDRVRRLRLVAPAAVWFYCLILKGGIFDGWAGWYYALQRSFVEVLLSLYLIENDLNLIEKPAAPESANERMAPAPARDRQPDAVL